MKMEKKSCIAIEMIEANRMMQVLFSLSSLLAKGNGQRYQVSQKLLMHLFFFSLHLALLAFLGFSSPKKEKQKETKGRLEDRRTICLLSYGQQQ